MSAETVYLVGLGYVVVLKLTCFLLGYLIIKIGAQLLREGISGEFKLKTELHGFKGDIASASPGLLFLIVGGILISYAMWVSKESSFQSIEAVANTTAPDVSIR